jgi:acetoacetyl-[acyl-carrier protein] synthase
MRKKTYVSAHGSSTPQNRQTESKMFDRFAEAFGFENLMVTAPKSWLGHTLGAASGDQILGALGSFEYQVISNIRNLDKIPEDVSRNHLRFLQDHHSIKESGMDCCVVNSKGFGGHNATALIYSPQLTKDYMHHKFSPSEQKDFEKNSEKNQKNREKWEEEYLRGAPMIEYNSTHPYDEDHIVDLGPEGMKIKGLEPKIKF